MSARDYSSTTLLATPRSRSEPSSLAWRHRSNKKRPRRARTADPRRERKAQSNTTQFDSSHQGDGKIVALTSPPSGPEEALAFFFGTVCSRAASDLPYRGYATELHVLYARAGPSSQLSTLTLAAAHLTYGIAMRSPRLLEESHRLYGRGLALTRKALNSRSAITSDDMLISIVLLTLYEHIERHYPTLEHDIHQNVIPKILSMRGFKQFENAQSKRIFFNIQTQMLHLCLARSESLKARIGKFSHVVNCDQSDYGTTLTGISLEAPELKAQAEILLRQSPTSPEALTQARSILRSAMATDHELKAWQTTNSLVPQYHVVDAVTIPWLDASQYPNGVHVYPDLASVSLWDCARMVRIHLNVILLHILHWMGPQRVQKYDKQCREYEETTLRMIDDIYATIPFRLGNRVGTMEVSQVRFVLGWTPMSEMWQEMFFKAPGTLIAPLATCVSVHFLSQERRDLLNCQARRICTMLRDPTAEEFGSYALHLETLPFVFFARAVDVSIAESETADSFNERREKGIQYACTHFDCWPKRFATFSNFLRHNNEQHREEKLVLHRCAACAKTFTRQQSLFRHVNDRRCGQSSARDSD